MPPPIRIVHIITRMILGGAQENTLFTVLGLHELPDCDVYLVTGPAIGPEGELIEEARQGGIDPIIVPEMRREIHPWRDLKTLWALARILRELKPHVVHTHSSKAGILGRIAAKRTRVPVIIHTIHGQAFHPNQSWFLNKLFIALERHCGRYTDRLITVADAMAEQAIAAGLAPRDKFQTIYSGMDVKPFLESAQHREMMRNQLGFNPGDRVVGKVARLAPLKGHEFVLELARDLCPRYPGLKFLFVGDGSLHDELLARARDMGIAERIVFAGLVPAREIPAYISAMDILIHTSLREGLARVLPQALLCGKPVVSFDVDGAREVVIPGETGFLIQPRALGPLKQAVETLLSDENLGARLGARGRELFAHQFDKAVMVEQIDRVYRDELMRKGISAGQVHTRTLNEDKETVPLGEPGKSRKEDE